MLWSWLSLSTINFQSTMFNIARQPVSTKVDLVGLVFVDSKRNVSVEMAEKIIYVIRSANTPGRIEHTIPTIHPITFKNKTYLNNIIKNSLSQKE